ncbi:hypothetical protein E6W39_26415 [Kitasatospora acidiphila]|uniref:Uncharacterized protein n=1 Tax=Kitasatospora acidiphila TaxID=2567942 RepID=A0A540W9R1_9ACTN|nr:hypothetical protein [Kitasatospora acidiphila]TQF05124.1 hypothetical protein E6W39_26415 [Kitasatospora acidiphila]
MRWRDAKGVCWRIRRHRLAGVRRIKPEWANDIIPGGLGQDPISFLLALPAMIVLAVLVPLWLVEWLIRLLLTPFAAVLRLTGQVPYRVTVLRNNQEAAFHTPRGYGELRRALAGLRPQR